MKTLFLKNRHRTRHQARIVFITVSFFLFQAVPAFAGQTHKDMLNAVNLKISGEYVRHRFLKLMKKPFSESQKKKALIIGDSHAQDFLNMVLENHYLKDYQISTRYIPTRCQITLDEANQKKHTAAKDRVFCTHSDSLSQARKQIAEADLIVLASNWKMWSAKALPETIKKLELKPQQKLFVIGRKSFGKISVRNYLRFSKEALHTLRNKVDARQSEINSLMNNRLDATIFIDVQQLVCQSKTDCPVFTDTLKLISFDGGHLTQDGAHYIGKILFSDPKLASL